MMSCGILSGIAWALETVALALAMKFSPFGFSERALLLAPFISTFLHDTCSALWSILYNALRGQLGEVWHAFSQTRSGKGVMLAAVVGGPVGMTGYVLTINQLGPSIGAVASAIFPAVGAALACIFLKESMRWYQWGFLGAALLGVYGLSYSPVLNVQNFWLGLLGAMMCALGWGVESVILDKCMRDPEVKDEYALLISQVTSALVYGMVILPLAGAWPVAVTAFAAGMGKFLPLIALAGFFANLTYFFYYRSISRIGASKAVALNITYVAWSMVFTVVLLGDTTVLTPLTIFCAADVLFCGVLAAADFRELLPLRPKHS